MYITTVFEAEWLPLVRNGLYVSRLSFMCLALFAGAHLFLIAKNGVIMGGYFLLASSAAG